MSAAFRRSLKKLVRYEQISKEMTGGTAEDEIGGWIALAWMKIIDVTLY
jgi:hypothetical protein